MAQRLLLTAEPRLDELTMRLVERVAGDLGRVGRGHWTALAPRWIREFLDCLVADDGERILAPGSVFELAGARAAQEGVDAETLVTGIRLANRLTQGQVHRAVLKGGGDHDTEMTLELLERVLLLGELVATAAQRGHDAVLVETSDEEALARRLATELVHGGSSASQVADRLGWDPSDLAVAVVAPPGVAVALREGDGAPLAWTRREHDIVLALPVRSSRTAISLRPGLDGHDVAVGTAVPLADFRESLALAESASGLQSDGEAAVFADDRLLEMVTVHAPMALRALRRKHLAEIDRLPDPTRTELLGTLREWLRWWGHRPSIAAALYVHPQTVSGRISRLKDLLAHDLEDPDVRSELLVLLIADAAKVTGATRSHA